MCERKEMCKDRKRRVLLVCFLSSLAMFLFGAGRLYGQRSEYYAGKIAYEAVKRQVLQPETKVFSMETEGKQEVTIDFEKLYHINADVVGWIQLDEMLEIDYPLVQGQDNAKYLETTFDGKKNAAGCLFLDCKNKKDFSDQNTIIYGHNMKDGSMFGHLRKYREEAFCREHPYFHIYAADGRMLVYEIFAVSIVNDSAEYYDKIYEGSEGFWNYLSLIKKDAIYFKEEKVTELSKMVTLSTCTNRTADERLLVQGVLIEEISKEK